MSLSIMWYHLLLFALFPLDNFASADSTPLVIGHRGASGMYPELTLKAIEAAADQGADFVEIDTAVTRDKHVIVLHEPELSHTTNVANFSQFASRVRNDTVWSDNWGHNATDWFTWNFDLHEIRLMRKRQRMSYRDQSYNEMFSVPTLEEALRTTRNRNVGLLIEVKLCKYFNNRTAADTASLVAKVIEAAGVTDRPDLVRLQSFELDCATKLKRLLPRLPVYKLEMSATVTDAQLLSWSRDSKLDGIGVHKAMVAMGGGDPTEATFTNKYAVTGHSDLVRRAKFYDMPVLVWTFRNEDRHIPWTFGQDAGREILFHRDAGVQGFITDFPDTCRAALLCKSATATAATAATAAAAVLTAAAAAVVF